MRKARPLLALTCLLDLLFVMVFVALLLEEPQKLEDLQGVTEAQELEIETLKSQNSQMEDQINETTAKLNQAKGDLNYTQSELEKAKSDLVQAQQKQESQQNSQQNTIISKGVWRQEIKVNGIWKDGGTHFHFLDSQKKCHSAILSFDSTWLEVSERKSELPCDEQLQVWEWDVYFRSIGNATFSLTKQRDGLYYGWMYVDGQKRAENRWVKIQDNLPLNSNN